MGLKLRYSAFLLSVALLLVLVCLASVYLVYQGRYGLTVLILAALYLCTYQLGKRFTKIFFLLFFLRTLRKRGGTITLGEYERFMEQSLGSRRSTTERIQLQDEILAALQDEGAATVVDETIYLLT